ncbi:MAG TPA: type II secretion system F family protein [Caulobacteraceae bacterium]|nr:type II secretion system F family protein [Caulobacteraceae bacterium]
MATYRYRAATPAGDLRAGVLEGASAADVLESLRRTGLIPIEAAETRIAGSGVGKGRPNAAARQALINALGELAVLLDAGMTLDRALSISVENARTPALKATMTLLRDRVKEGAQLSRAMRELRATLPPMASAMTEAGEANGRLAQALARLAETLDYGEALRRTIVSSLIYPALLISIATGVIGVMLLFVIPQFETLFSDQAVKLPFATRMVMGASHLLRAYGWAAALCLVVGVFLGSQALRRPQARRALDRALLAIPTIGPLAAKAETARFARVLASLVDGGVPVPTALGIAERSIANQLMRQAVSDVGAGLKQGGGLSRPLAETGLFPSMAISFIRTGEETAQLGLMLGRLADVLDREVRTTLGRLVELITPIVTLGMAAMVGGVIASIISAILGFNDLAISS